MEKKEKSKTTPSLMYAFCLSVVFALLHMMVHLVFVAPLSQWIFFSNPTINNAVQGTLLALISSFLCCTAFGIFPHNRKLVPAAFLFLPVYTGLCFAYVALFIASEDRLVLYPLIAFVLLPSAVLGPAISFVIYNLLKKRSK